MSYKHITKDGKELLLEEISDDHLINIINMIKRLAKRGITVREGGGVDADDIWYSEDDLFGKDVKKFFHYKKYKKELKRRKK